MDSFDLIVECSYHEKYITSGNRTGFSKGHQIRLWKYQTNTKLRI